MAEQSISYSIIIPTYNRAETVRQTLHAIAGLDYPAAQIEVVIVDDGSTDATPLLATGPAAELLPFDFRLIRRERSGATMSRNSGAQASTKAVLLFLDDDMELAPQTLQIIAQAFTGERKAVVLGAFEQALPANASPFARALAEAYRVPSTQDTDSLTPAPFAECKLGILAVRRDHFFQLGMFQDPTGAWPNWDDVDFGYRAHLAGFEFLRTNAAVGCHHDWAAVNLSAHSQRIERASRAAARLIHKHPALLNHLPMLQDKAPIDPRRDSPALMLHKGLHSMTAWGPALAGLKASTHLLERCTARPEILWPIYRWIISGHIYRGYRQGLSEQRRPDQGKRE